MKFANKNKIGLWQLIADYCANQYLVLASSKGARGALFVGLVAISQGAVALADDHSINNPFDNRLRDMFGSAGLQLKEVTLSAASASQSEPISVRAWANDWQGDFYPGEQAYSFNRVKLMAHYYGGLRVGWQTRYDYVTRFNEATARLYYENENGLLGETPETDIFLYAQHLRAAGVTFGLSFPFNERFNMSVDVTRLRAHDLIQGDLSGQISINAETEFLANAQVDYAYQQDEIFDRPVEGRTLCWGWAVDLSLGWQVSERWRAQIDIVDAWNRVEWHRAPFTRATINTVDKVSDQGTISVDPAVIGFEGVRDQRQRLPVRTRAIVSRQFNSGFRTHVAWQRTPIQSVLEWGIDYPLSRDASGAVKHEIGVSVIVPVNAIELRQKFGPVYWALSTDRVNISDAHWLSAKLGVSIAF